MVATKAFAAGLFLSGLAGAFAGWEIGWDPAPLLSAPARHPQLCGVEFRNGHYRFREVDGRASSLAVEHWATHDGSGSDALVMRFDAPADYVDFLAQAGDPGIGDGRAYLVAFDGGGRMVDIDTGSVAGGRPVTMQVTADTPVIREARFFIEGEALRESQGAASEVIVDLDVGAFLPGCG